MLFLDDGCEEVIVPFQVSIPLEYCRKKPDLGLNIVARPDAKDLKVLDEMRIIAKNNTASCISAIPYFRIRKIDDERNANAECEK